MNESIKLTQKQVELKNDFVKYVAMLIRKYGNIETKKKEKEVA